MTESDGPDLNTGTPAAFGLRLPVKRNYEHVMMRITKKGRDKC